MEITEKQFESQVKDLAKLFGWLYYHTWRSIHSPAGFPDTVMVRGSRIIFAELKSEKGKVSPKQEEWLNALIECSYTFEEGYGSLKTIPKCEVYLWRPEQLEEIAEVLR